MTVKTINERVCSKQKSYFCDEEKFYSNGLFIKIQLNKV